MSNNNNNKPVKKTAVKTNSQTQSVSQSTENASGVGVNFEAVLDKLRNSRTQLGLQNNELQLSLITLEKIRDHYVDLFDHAPVGYVTLNEDGGITEVNLTAVKLLGKDRKAIINHNFNDFISEDYKALWTRHFQNAKVTTKRYGCELPFGKHGEAPKYYHLDCLVNKTPGIHDFMRVTMTDVTERKLTEAQLRIAAAAFEAQESILVTDPDRVIQRVNNAFTRITGYSPEEAIGNTPAMLRSGLHDEDFYENILSAIANKGYWQGEIWNKRKDGEIFPVFQTITRVTDETGEITHYVGAMVDITGQKQAEKILLEARTRLESQVVSTQEELEKTRQETNEINTALNVLLKLRDKDKDSAQTALSNEVEATIIPLLKKLKGANNNHAQTRRTIGMIEDNIKHLMLTYGRANHLDAAYQKLSPIEKQVASMVKLGNPTKVIAAALNIAGGTVNLHRKHIRKKLGLDSKTNLQNYLQSLSD